MSNKLAWIAVIGPDSDSRVVSNSSAKTAQIVSAAATLRRNRSVGFAP